MKMSEKCVEADDPVYVSTKSRTTSDTAANILYSLSLENTNEKDKEIKSSDISLRCLQCDQHFDFPKLKDDYLGHLFLEHRLVIADVDDIGDLTEYFIYWENEFKKGYDLQEYCTTILLDQLPNGEPSKNEKYYLLSDILPQDYELRKCLHNKRLEKVLTQYQYERSDRSFSRECLYCRDVIKGSRSNYIEHLYNKHFLQLGKSENLVYIDELIDYVQDKLENLICIFCEKIFKDRPTLKEHMRKKGHKRINPDIKFYDKYYLENYKIEKPKHCKNMNINNGSSINSKNKKYLNLNNSESRRRHQQQEQKDNDSNLENRKVYEVKYNNSDDDDSDWSDWDGEKIQLKCFFCKRNDIDFNNLKIHMLNEHHFNFDKLIKSITFYQKIKIVNYIRRQIHILNCIVCNEHYENLDELQKHMIEMKHFDDIIDNKKQWDRPEYFFPTYEDDGILYLLDDIDNSPDDNNIIGCVCSNNDSNNETSVTIISEDLKASINKDAEALSMENFKI